VKQFLLSIVLLFVGHCVALGQSSDRITEQDGNEAIRQWLSQIPFPQSGLILSIDDPMVVQGLPAEHFYVLRYPRYPVAQALPEDLSYNNLLVVHLDGKVERVSDTGGLENLFRSNLVQITDQRLALIALNAWLRLSQEFHQDGFFEFQKPVGKSNRLQKGAGIVASGKTIVIANAGNRGEITVVLRFDRAGKLSSAQEIANVISGRRPNF
jgi:hypothetical protein